jgi:hypothetical protein
LIPVILTPMPWFMVASRISSRTRLPCWRIAGMGLGARVAAVPNLRDAVYSLSRESVSDFREV